MAKLRRVILENECYHVVAATRDRRPVFHDVTNASLLVDALQFLRPERAFLLAYAVMPDHLHVVLVPKDGQDVSRVMQTVKGYTARVINARRGVRGPLWQHSFYDRIIFGERQLWDTIAYVHNNPVVDGLSQTPEGYPYSSAARPDNVDLEEFFS